MGKPQGGPIGIPFVLCLFCLGVAQPCLPKTRPSQAPRASQTLRLEEKPHYRHFTRDGRGGAPLALIVLGRVPPGHMAHLQQPPTTRARRSSPTAGRTLGINPKGFSPRGQNRLASGPVGGPLWR